jgi:hypothetical protein
MMRAFRVKQGPWDRLRDARGTTKAGLGRPSRAGPNVAAPRLRRSSRPRCSFAPNAVTCVCTGSWLRCAYWSSFGLSADAGRAPFALARAEGLFETSASRRSVEVPRVATGSCAVRAPSVSIRQGTSLPTIVNRR